MCDDEVQLVRWYPARPAEQHGVNEHRGATADEALTVITSLLQKHGPGGSCNQALDEPCD